MVTRGVITQHYLQRNSNGSNSRGFFLQSTDATSDGDPNSSDGIFVFHGSFATLRIDGGGFAMSLPTSFDYAGMTPGYSIVRASLVPRGRELDAETGLYYYRARYYDAQVGRF